MLSLGRLALVAIGVLAFRSRAKIVELASSSAQRRHRPINRGDSVRLTDETPPPRTRLSTPDLSPEDAVVLPSATGRTFNNDVPPDFVDVDQVNLPISTIPKSQITGRHDEGSDANETIDGLDETAELTRRLAEESPVADREEDDVPVFERGRTKTVI